MALLPVKPLDAVDGYLRWKESVLLRLHTVGIAHVLSHDPPSGSDAASSAEAAKWARDDAMCRGHILATLSDRLLPDYVHHATGRALWEAVARTYDVAWQRFTRFEFDDGAPLLEQLAHAEALGVTGRSWLKGDLDFIAYMCHEKLPADLAIPISVGSVDGNVTMDRVWKVARVKEASRLREVDELQGKATMAEDPRGCWNCGQPGHISRNCRA
ncbi:uncharacterized protein LOC120672431 [Panicum virgatum]|uniref:CCHC-type domain-containing protein n=1 Tax=Panicum virgatum TaxID=38727 RepID=A0A8T0RWL4_PANVG|nr:uncharacterized protein LOC120672431 [Panicum virgatum]KAG2588769.1 hypothetical protein PVAP13_5NG233681 [Panicum virgatum]